MAQAQGPVYAFVDESGEVHLSNVPGDARYAPIDPLPVKEIVNPAPNHDAPPEPDRTRAANAYDALVAQTAGRYGLDAALLHAVISVESGYNAKAVSRRGASGLMQLMPTTAKRYGVANVLDPAENVRAGAQYLSDLLRLFQNDLQLALAAYNAGEAAVIKYGRSIPPYRETVAYVPKVVAFYRRLRLSM